MAIKLKPRLKTLCKEVLSSLDGTLSTEESQNLPWYILRKLVSDRAETLGTLGEKLLEICESKDITGYFELQCFNDPTVYGSDHQKYLDVTTVLSFLKKYPFGKVANLDPLLAAKRRFHEAERLCRATNKRLKWFRNRGYRLEKTRPGMHAIIHRARLTISSLLGSVDLNKIYDQSRHGPGGAIAVSGLQTTAYYKYAAPLYTVTSRALPYAVAAVLADQQWRRYVCQPESILGDPVPTTDEAFEKVWSRLRVTSYNKVTFVPKTAQTHRAIAVEPLMNIYLQLGVGSYFRDCLRRFGVDLSSQSRNQLLACLGSTDILPFLARPATLDLSMASDTLSIELVKELLPEDWFNLLSDLRADYGMLEGERLRWAKFSSMGNGFTFELESLIFYSLVESVMDSLNEEKGQVSIYGDDIIVPGTAMLRVVEVLNYAGFRVNTEKTFAFGPFRESCGRDWFSGVDVRPFFLKREMKKRRDLLLTLNTFYIKNVAGEFQGAYTFLLGRLPGIIKNNLLGPVTSDLNGHVFAPIDVAVKSQLVDWDKNVQSWSYVSIKDVAKTFRGSLGPIHLQMMDRTRHSQPLQDVNVYSFGRGALKSNLLSGWSNSPFGWSVRFVYLLAKWVDDLSSDRGSSSDITQRQSTGMRLLTQLSNEWGNK